MVSVCVVVRYLALLAMDPRGELLACLLPYRALRHYRAMALRGYCPTRPMGQFVAYQCRVRDCVLAMVKSVAFPTPSMGPYIKPFPLPNDLRPTRPPIGTLTPSCRDW